MDLTQKKLDRSEWESIEIPCSASELVLLNLVKDGFYNTDIRHNTALTILAFLKMEPTVALHNYMFIEHFEKPLKKSFEQNNISIQLPEVSKKMRTPCKADLIRIERAERFSAETRSVLFEFTILKRIEKMVQWYRNNDHKWVLQYYALTRLCNVSLASIANQPLIVVTKNILNHLMDRVNIPYLVEHASEYIEDNLLMQYDDLCLYTHQKQIFEVIIANKKRPSLILYSAPTGTGKTVTPIGIAEKKRVIFVCAARHVGLALAKSAISVGRKVAFAFGCETADDIRLHYAAAIDYTKNKRSGSIQKVDNTRGEKVEMLICDIASYLPSMHYMLAFNTPDNLVTYWDEPTIALDQEEHPLHAIISRNWNENLIPTVVLSTATLPTAQNLLAVTTNFCEHFPGAQIIDITSHECRKTVPLIDVLGRIVLPHHLDTKHSDAVNRANECLANPRLLRYIDVGAATEFIANAEKKNIVPDTGLIMSCFDKVLSITPRAIKEHYLRTIINMDPQNWDLACDIPRTTRFPTRDLDSLAGARLTTKDAHTLTDGPSIFLVSDVSKVARVLLREAAIPSTTMQDIASRINANNIVADTISDLEREIEDLSAQDERGANKTKTKRKGGDNEERDEPSIRNPRIGVLTNEISVAYSQVRPISINDVFIPNTLMHREKWASGKSKSTPFTSTIIDNTTNSSNTCSKCGKKKCTQHFQPKSSNRESNVVTEVSALSGVDDAWKILLLMGVGVFGGKAPRSYTEIVKRLADQQRLYLIIADGDYIYGSNYQFCHGIIGKDVKLTREKIVQAVGRVGRHTNQNHTVRFRTDEHIKKLFPLPSADMEIEAVNMNRLLVRI